MVSLDRVHVIGSWYMSFHGGYKPQPQAFINYFKSHEMKPKRLFFLGNKANDMKLATKLKRKLKCKVFKCLILREGDHSLGKRHADQVVKNLWEVKQKIDKFKPDLVMSDFDNTLVKAGAEDLEATVERVHFWEFFNNYLILRYLYGFFSQLSIPFLRKKPYTAKYDHTESFLRTLKQTLVIHSMSPEGTIKLALRKILK